MTKERFIELITSMGLNPKMENSNGTTTMEINHDSSVHLSTIKGIPAGINVIFNNTGTVYLSSCESIQANVTFNNSSDVHIEGLKKISNNLIFNNGRDIIATDLVSIDHNIEFKNEHGVYLQSLVGGWISYWDGNISYVKSKDLLNLMIKKGLFE